MTLSHRTDYALRALMYLAEKWYSNSRLPIPSLEIAAAFDIRQNHLVKIINELSHRGYVRTSRGNGGGVELSRPPEEIRLSDVIEDLQGQVQLHECAEKNGFCVIESFCKLRGIFRQADELQRNFLNRFTLADVVPASQQSPSFDPVI